VAHHHRGRGNYVFVDGHVKALKPIQTLLPRSRLWGPPHLVDRCHCFMYGSEFYEKPMDRNNPIIQSIHPEFGPQ
jgi:prepilin-type processing-associated H-X9-DG protein